MEGANFLEKISVSGNNMDKKGVKEAFFVEQNCFQ